MTAGALDGIAGLGPARRARLLKELGGVRALRAASEEDLRALPWLPDQVAGALYRRLHGRTERPAPPGRPGEGQWAGGATGRR